VAGRPQSTVSDAWGRVYTAKDAKAMGMVDKIRTMSETLGAYGIDQARAAQAGRQRATELRSAQLNAALAAFQSLGVSV
jgi:ClpP class serine protease